MQNKNLKASKDDPISFLELYNNMRINMFHSISLEYGVSLEDIATSCKNHKICFQTKFADQRVEGWRHLAQKIKEKLWDNLETEDE